MISNWFKSPTWSYYRAVSDCRVRPPEHLPTITDNTSPRFIIPPILPIVAEDTKKTFAPPNKSPNRYNPFTCPRCAQYRQTSQQRTSRPPGPPSAGLTEDKDFQRAYDHLDRVGNPKYITSCFYDSSTSPEKYRSFSFGRALSPDTRIGFLL